MSQRKSQKCGPLPRGVLGLSWEHTKTPTPVAQGLHLQRPLWGLSSGSSVGVTASPTKTRPEAARMGADPEGMIQKGFLWQVRGWATPEIVNVKTAKMIKKFN